MSLTDITPVPDPPVVPAAPPIPAEVWAFWCAADGDDDGYWLPNLYDSPAPMTHLVSFSEADARATADSFNDYHGLDCRPVRIK